jgi:hypothetical protein
MRKQGWIRKNSLSLTFFILFLISLVGTSISGLHSYNQQLSSHKLPEIQYAQYLRTGTFLDGIFVNWQAAILQLGSLIFFGAFLYQKGASHSRKPEEDSREKRKQERRGRSWIYRNSFSLGMTVIFLASFVAHMVFGTSAQNELLMLSDQPRISVHEYIKSGTFWFKTLQAWEAEFIAIFIFLILSIYLRQQNSAESKPVNADNQVTGEVNV